MGNNRKFNKQARSGPAEGKKEYQIRKYDSEIREINEQSERQIYLITQTQENGQEMRFLHVLTASIRKMRQKTFKLAIFLGPVIKHSRNEPQCGKSAKSDDFFSRNRPKTLTLAIFGALSPSYA